MKLSHNFLDQYVSTYAKKRREKHDSYCYQLLQHQYHFDGLYPEELIERKRPAEDSDIKDYRKVSYQPMTKPTASKIYTSLQKIRKSPDWSIAQGEEVKRIATDEDIFTYMYEQFPKFKSVERWAFNLFLRKYLMDAGAIVVTMPTLWDVADNSYYKPYSYVINSPQIYDYIPNELFVWKSNETITFREGKTDYEGWVVYAITPTEVYRWEQTKTNGAYRLVFQKDHNLGLLPCFEVGCVVVGDNEKSLFYETRVAGIIPALNEATCLYSDIQAEVVQHIHSTMYSYQAQECVTCSGSGQTIGEEAVPIKCPSCKGKGVYPFNPYEHVTIRTGLGENVAPTPPVGYITKDTTIITILDTRFKQQLFDALSSINMEFLAETPLNQSGTAKQVDAEELNNFVYSVAEDIVSAINVSTFHSALWRYSALNLSDEDYLKMMPIVNIPTHFDIVSDSVMLDEITRMSTAKIDSTLLKATNVQYARKKFSSAPEIGDAVIARMELDPLSGMGDDAILLGKQDGYIKDTDLVIHYNVNQFIDRAIQENKNFGEMDKKEKQALMLKYAQEFEIKDINNQTPPIIE